MADEPPETLPGVISVPVTPGPPGHGPEFLVPDEENGQAAPPEEPLQGPEAPATVQGHGPLF